MDTRSDAGTTDAALPHGGAVDGDDFVGPLMVDRYTLLEPIGSGGMGRVFRAIDPELDRMVAIKALRKRDPRLLARLRREAQALAQLHSPNVVDVYDVIVQDDALYIAMELVRGPTLSTWARTVTSWRAQLDVLLQAGEGVVAAHRAGLLHRDLKPANILVGDDGRVRVMDFGLVLGLSTPSAPDDAQTLDLTEHPLEPRLTDHEHVIGTLPYMAPEQHAGLADERSDQFAFCVTAFEILHGARPFRGGTRREQLQAKQSGDIWQPSENAVPIAVHRVLCRGLAAKPDDRFPAMDALLHELRRAASRPRRTRLAIAGASVLAAAVLAVLLLASANDEPVGASAAVASEPSPVSPTRRLAEAHLRDAQEQAELAHWDAAAESYRKAYFAARSSDALDIGAKAATALVGVLSRELGRHDQAAAWAEHARVEVERLGEPEAAIRLEMAEGALSSSRGDYERALEHFQHARADAQTLADPSDVLGDALNGIGAAQYHAGHYDEALASLQQALEEVQQRRGPDHPMVATVLTNLGGTYEARGDEEAAIEHYQRALAVREAALGHEHPNLAPTLINLGTVFYAQRRDAEALAQYRRALALVESTDPPPAAELGPLLNNLGMVTSGLGDDEAALAYHERALVVYETAYGPEHPEVAVTLMLLGALLGEMGQHARALERLAQAQERVERSLGAEHPRATEVLHELGRVHSAMGKHDQAVAAFERALAMRVAIGVESDITRFHLARALWDAGHQRTRAIALARDARESFHDGLPQTQLWLERADTWLAERVNAP